ncbi:hypothetical protein GQX74_013005 [Glossina fuscipes]|nr:hypothetical protein GQX74_013005 [Glossina fuscipes]
MALYWCLAGHMIDAFRAKLKSYREILIRLNSLTNISLIKQCPNTKFSCIYVWHVNEYHRRHRPYQAHTRTTQYFIYNYYKNGNCVIETVIVMRSNERKNISVTKSTKNKDSSSPFLIQSLLW